tara:strand:+ start:494 stop:1279 length:786 start_codon:yes stop_codon:yes gene_type:complete
VTKLEKQQTGSVLMGLAGFCVFLLLPFPVSIYYVTRIIICVGAIYGAFRVYKYFPERKDMVIFLGVIALIFNPLFPFYFQIRTVWMFMDFIAAIAFYSSANIFKERLSSVTEESYSSSQNYQPTQKKYTSGVEEKVTSSIRSDEVTSGLTDAANLVSKKKQVSRKEFKSDLDVAVQYFFEVAKEIYEGNFTVREASMFRVRFQAENNFKLGLWKITRIESEAISFASHHNEIIISQVFSRGKLQKDHPKVVEVKDYLKTIV